MTLRWPNRTFGLSDDQEVAEVHAQRRLTAAAAEMRAAIELVKSTSVLVEIEPFWFEDFVHDQCPTAEYWNEKLTSARNG